MKTGSSKLSRRRGNDARTRAEMVTLAISLALLAALVGGLLWLDLSRGDARPRIAVTPHFEDAYRYDDAWYLPVTVANKGDRTTDALRVDLVRPISGEQPEVVDLQFAFVAGGEQVEGLAVFDERPTADTIEVDVVATTEP